MPYIAVRCYPRGDEDKQKLAEALLKAAMETWGTPQQAFTISVEDVPKEEWDEKVQQPIIEPNMDKMLFVRGEKQY